MQWRRSFLNMAVMKVVRAVRRYGPVGGMERYVWEATQALRDLGHEVEVVCEVCTARPAGIVVHELGTVMPRPRWLALLRFGMGVRRWLQANPRPGWVVHSHERLGCHDVTTFHGPPFATIFEKPWWRWLSLRVVMQLFLEIRELAVSRQVIPVSDQVARQLLHYYPWVRSWLAAPVVPAVAEAPVFPPVPRRGRHVIGFVGREWRRKGLAQALDLVGRLRQVRPDVELLIVGPEPEDVAELMRARGTACRLVPWSARVPYEAMDVLLHPARSEPFGMVVTEALAAGVPVVVSEACGAASVVTYMHGDVVPLDAEPAHWLAALERQLDRTTPVPPYRRSWIQAARETEAVYGVRRPPAAVPAPAAVAASAAGTGPMRAVH